MDWYLAHLAWKYSGRLAFVLCVGYALWRGGPTERKGAALVATTFLLSPVLTQFDGPGPGAYVRALDIGIFIGFIILALQSRRLWVFAICMCSLNGLVTYFFTGYEAFGMYSFVTATGFWLGYALLICLAAGTADYRRTLKRQTLNSALAT